MNKALLQIDKDDEKQLVKCLLECPTIKNEESRERLLKELQPSLSTPIGFNKSLMLHVHSIVNACIKDNGGIETLIKLLRYFEEDDTPVQAVENKLKDILTPKPITNTQLKKLRSLLKSFSLPDDDKLKAIYEKSVHKNMSEPQNYQISGLLNYLAKMGTSSTGYVPILYFVVLLMQHAKNLKAKTDLKAWIREVGEHLTLTEAQIDGLNDESEPNRSLPLHLLIELEPEDDELDDNFIVYAWCVKSPKDIINVSLDKTFTLDEMPKLISKLLNYIKHDLIAANNKLTIEFFLPLNLLKHPIDYWVTLVHSYPVEIRNRLRNVENRIPVFNLEHPTQY